VARTDYRDALEALRADVADMGDLVSRRLDASLTALADGDRDLARRVHEGDDEVDERYRSLEADCIDLFALEQPVAGDLRFVAASYKVVTDLERVGDLATNFAEYATDGDDLQRGVDVQTIGDEAGTQVETAVEAYRGGDPETCRAVVRRDDEVDALCQRAGESVVRGLLADGDATPWAAERALGDVSRALLTVRDLERVGDHAANVAARTLYAVESDTSLLY
jgi:phosphate transport system protein